MHDLLQWQTSVSIESTVSTSYGPATRRADTVSGWSDPLGGMEGRITQDNHALFKLSNQPLKGIIRDIGRGTRPPHDQPPLIQEQTAFAADNPAMIRETFAANLLGAAAFAHGVDQLDAVGVDDTEHRRSGQEGLVQS